MFDYCFDCFKFYCYYEQIYFTSLTLLRKFKFYLQLLRLKIVGSNIKENSGNFSCMCFKGVTNLTACL